jgi:hypothetical protein
MWIRLPPVILAAAAGFFWFFCGVKKGQSPQKNHRSLCAILAAVS